MKDEQNYISDIAEIRSMMERSTKFLSLSGWSGVIAGIYALIAAYAACRYFNFHPVKIAFTEEELANAPFDIFNVLALAGTLLVVAVATSVFLSNRKAVKRGDKLWDPTTRRLLVNMAVPLVTGGILILVMISHGLIGLIMPLTLIFYGLALYNAGRFTFEEVKIVGLIQIAIGLVSAFYVEYGLEFWGLGFGFTHIVYGIYMHYKYER